MTYSIIDLNLDSVESTHATLDAALAHWQERSELAEYRDGKTITRPTTYGLHHRIRDDSTGEWAP